MKDVSNVELALLQMLFGEKELSGYRINKLVMERGYKEWAGIGQTSIYVGLGKLKKKGLVVSRQENKKTGKGPIPRKFSLTPEGFKVLKEEVKKALSVPRGRFELGVAAMFVLSKKDILAALNARKAGIEKELPGLKEKYRAQGGEKLPLYVRALFNRPFMLMETEIHFMREFIKEVRAWKGNTERR